MATKRVEDISSFKSFESLGLKEDLLRGIYAYGYERPSAIQQRAIRPTIMGKKLIAQAQSGTGKTATFAIGTLASVDHSIRHCQSLILAPTRELVKQISLVTEALAEYTDMKIHACFGGRAVRDDIRILRSGVPVVIGTPGRASDMIQRRALNVDHLKQFFL